MGKVWRWVEEEGEKKKKRGQRQKQKKKKNERGGGVVVNQIQILKSLAGFSFGAPSSPPSCPSTVLTRAQTSPTPCKQGQIWYDQGDQRKQLVAQRQPDQVKI